MSLNLSQATVLQMERGDLHAVDGLWLTVLEGRVWVTRSEDPQDHFIGPGGALRLAAGCGALLQAEAAARVRLTPLVEVPVAPRSRQPPLLGRRLRARLQAVLGPAPA
jgi:hypothetical protein